MAQLSGGKWTPFKELLHVVSSAVMERQPGAYYDLDAQLTKHKPNLISLLQHAPKNSSHCSEVRSSVSTPIKLPGYKSRQTFPQVFIDEALILSNILDLNEFSSVELLLTAEQQQPRFPWLSRGLVSVLLYHDGRQSLLRALKILIQAREGISWSYELDANVSTLIMNFTNELFENGLVEKILKLLKGFSVEGELDKLHKGRAVGDDRHRVQLVDLIEEQRSLLSECLFYWACQNPFPSEQAIAMLRHLKNLPVPTDGVLDIVTLNIFMTILYCFNIGEPNVDNFTDSLMDSKFPLSNDACFLSAVHKVITEEGDWINPSLQAAVKFGWAVLLRECSNWEAFSDKEELADDERLLDEVVGRQVFPFLQEAVIGCNGFHQEEYFVRRFHWLVTTFITMMPLKIKELHNRCSEDSGPAVRRPVNRVQPTIVTPKKAMESLMLMIGDLYGCDVHQLELCLDYWSGGSSGEVIVRGAHHSRVPHKQVTLNKFVRQCSSYLPSNLFVPFLHMLNGLCTGTKAAGYVFDALKAWRQPGAVNNISWDHFFGSIQQYSLGLKQNMGTSQTASGCAVTPEELAGLGAVLQLIRTVTDQNEAARVAMAENKLWSPVQSLFTLLSCAVPYSLKAEVLLTLASFAKSPEITASMWHTLELSQVFSTIPLDAHQGGIFRSQLSLREGSIQLELEEVESQAQEYPETRAFLCLLDALTDVPVPPTLGAGQRSQTGFQPYLSYLRDSVLLRFDARSYRFADEKWQVATAVMKILVKLLRNYDCSGTVTPGDPGHILMRHMLNNSQFLKKILLIVHEGAVILSGATSSTSSLISSHETVSRAALLALQLLEVGLSKQESFLAQLKAQTSGTREINVTPLDELMMGINAHSGQADHLINVTKYVTFLSCSPELAQSAVKILCWIVRSSRIGSKFVSILHQNQETWRDIQHGFVEWLETITHDSQTSEAVMEIQALLREDIVKLLVYSVTTPAPNIAHLLLGYDITKPLQETNLQDPGVMKHPRTCLHSVLALIEPTSNYNSMACHNSNPKLAMLCYQLIYLLCSNKLLSAPTLRYLRSNHNFFHVQVMELPMMKEGFAHKEELCSPEELALVRQLSWLLKSVAVELRMTAVSRQRSYFQGLVDALVDESSVLQTSTNQSGIIQNKRRVLHLLNNIEFRNRDIPQLQLMHINIDRLEEVISGLVIYDEPTGVQFTDVKLLRKLIMGDLGIQGAGTTGHRPQIMEEIHQVLEHVVERNQVTDNNHAQCELFNAWRQVVEVMMTSSGSHDFLQSDSRMALLFELLHDLLLRMEGDMLPELLVAGHGVVLTLISLLEQTFQKIEGVSSSAYGDAVSVSRLQTGPMQGILKGLVDGLVQATSGQQLSRAYLYGALLYYLQMTSKQAADQFTGAYLQPGYDESSLMAGNVHILTSYGNDLMETVCKDACSGHDVDKMLALSLLHSIVSIDLSQSWLHYMHMNGYLQTICSTLQMDDANLQRALKPAPEPLRALYIYESKMAFLSGAAKTPLGCKYLLHSNCLVYLSDCQFLDMFPNLEAHHGYISLLSQPIGTVDDQFVPTVIDRYNNQMLRPALSLAVTLITSSGPHKQETILQVSHFILAHLELFGTILRDHISSISLGSLEVLALSTSLISHCGIGQNITNESSGEEHAEQLVGLSRIQRLMLLLMPKYCSTSNWKLLVKEVEKQLLEGDEGDGLDETIKQQLLDQCQTISANLVAYCAIIMTNKESSKAYCNIVFSADLVTKHPQWESLGNQAQAYTPTLGLLLHLLKECTTNCQAVMEDSTTRKEQVKKSDLKKLRIKQYIYIIENCLYILWKHLEFYLLSAGAHHSNQHVVRQYMRNLKGGSVASVGRIAGMDTNTTSLSLHQIQAADFTFLKKLMDLRKVKEQEVEGSTGFIHAMIFRIKRLIKPAMTKQPVSQ